MLTSELEAQVLSKQTQKQQEIISRQRIVIDILITLLAIFCILLAFFILQLSQGVPQL